MKKVFQDVTELIGNTPLLELTKLEEKFGCGSHIFAKLEFLNPAGSIKDRAALSMLTKAREKGLLKDDSVIIEPTSGNTGIGLASIAAARGYRAIFVMPETMSKERQTMLRAYGASIVLTDGKKGMKGSIEKAQELSKQIPNSFLPGQFTNPDNCMAHEETTGPEIWHDLEGQVDCLISAVGTGGTITGTGRYLKKQNPEIQIVAVEPSGSPVLSGGKPGLHKIQGIGAGFVPEILQRNLIDQIMCVTDEDAYEMARIVAREQGILIGISAGASIQAAINLAGIVKKGQNIVVIIPDGGDRYFSTDLYPVIE